MKQETLARTIIETLIHKFFRDMENDPDRSIRNMIDLGMNFARGRFQREFFEALQRMLTNEQSAYYELVKNVVADTDHGKLQTFGMNLGFQACTLGADIIRRNEAKWNFNIPWTYHLMFGERGLSVEYLNKIVSEGKSLGTYVYVLFPAGEVLKEHAALLREHEDCAFILLTSPESVLGGLMDQIGDISNLLVLVEYRPHGTETAAEKLRGHGLFYGIYETCPSEDQSRLWEPSHLEQISRLRAAFYVLMPERPCDFKEDEERERAVSFIRNQQEYPFLLIDFVSDIQKIDRVISSDSCAVAFDAEGNVHTDTREQQDSGYNIQNRTLFEILEMVTKKEPERPFY